MCLSLECPISVPAALRRPQKKHDPGILDHVPYLFCRFLCVFSLVCPISMPAALPRPQQKLAPGILDHVPYVFCHVLYVFFINFDVWSAISVYHSILWSDKYLVK